MLNRLVGNYFGCFLDGEVGLLSMTIFEGISMCAIPCCGDGDRGWRAYLGGTAELDRGGSKWSHRIGFARPVKNRMGRKWMLGFSDPAVLDLNMLSICESDLAS
jgi:hypothetical protein